MLVNLAEAITLLKQGEIVAIPTETVYGLAADARNEDAIKNIYLTATMGISYKVGAK